MIESYPTAAVHPHTLKGAITAVLATAVGHPRPSGTDGGDPPHPAVLAPSIRRERASRARARWSFQPLSEPKELIDHYGDSQQHQQRHDEGGTHSSILRGGWLDRLLCGLISFA